MFPSEAISPAVVIAVERHHGHSLFASATHSSDLNQVWLRQSYMFSFSIIFHQKNNNGKMKPALLYLYKTQVSYLNCLHSEYNGQLIKFIY